MAAIGRRSFLRGLFATAAITPLVRSLPPIAPLPPEPQVGEAIFETYVSHFRWSWHQIGPAEWRVVMRVANIDDAEPRVDYYMQDLDPPDIFAKMAA